ncbi:MAG: sialidase family protein [Promethearchaeota archaeon]
MTNTTSLNEIGANNIEKPIFKDLFIGGKEGFHTFRIPSLITSKRGTLLAFAEARASRADVDQCKIALKRSEDKGKNWSELKIIRDVGKSSVTNPTAVSLDSGRIILFYQYYPYPYRERTVKAGLEGPDVIRNFFQYSDDDGMSWSEPIENTKSVKRDDKITTIASGPGRGIQIHNGKYKGRILIPYNQGPWGKWKNYCVYSDDGGQTWEMGNLAPGSGNETQIAELSGGRLIMNSRNYPKKISEFLRIKKSSSYRKVAYSSDGGQNWTKLKEDETLIEPNCHASLISFNSNKLLKNNYLIRDDIKKKDTGDYSDSWLVFSNPAHKYKRENGCIRLSLDEGKTWAYTKVLFKKKFGYSALTLIDEKQVVFGCLFETGVKSSVEKIVFSKFNLNWLIR